MPICIDLLITDLDYGGAESQVVDLLGLLSKDPGFRFRLISILPPVAFVDRLRAMGVEVISLNARSKFGVLMAFPRLLSLLVRNRTALVHAHMVHANLLARICRFFLPRLRVISTAHSSHEGGRLREVLYALTDRLSDLNTNVSVGAVERYIDVGASPRHKIRVVYNGIDTRRFRPAPDDVATGNSAFRWVAVGRLEEVKDYGTLLRSIKILKEGGRSLNLRVVGRGSQETRLREQLRQEGLEGHVQFVGTTDAVELEYQSADAFVLTSRYEGYGLVVAEAMACELPVVVTDCGGPREIVGDAGVLVQVGDAGQVAMRMADIMDMDRDARLKMGHAARERVVALFSLESTVERWKSIYREVIAR